MRQTALDIKQQLTTPHRRQYAVLAQQVTKSFIPDLRGLCFEYVCNKLNLDSDGSIPSPKERNGPGRYPRENES
jgi:hypothetical protein